MKQNPLQNYTHKGNFYVVWNQAQVYQLCAYPLDLSNPIILAKGKQVNLSVT